MPVRPASSTRPAASFDEIDLRELQAARLQQALHACAEGAGLGRINDYLPGIAHYFIKCSATSGIRWAKASRRPRS